MKVWVRAILYTFILSYTLLYNLKHFYTILNTPLRSQAQYLYLFLTNTNIPIIEPTSIKSYPLNVFKLFISL